jgi:hypothetical protein
MNLLGWGFVLVAIGLAVTAWMGSDSKGKNREELLSADPAMESTHRQAVALQGDGKSPPQRRPRLHADETTDPRVESHLRNLYEQGDLDAIHSELTAMAESDGLGGARPLLNVWCREGGMEVAQLCLVLSEGDADLNLELCVAALSNPSDVIRDLAASRLEHASGMTFGSPSEAEAWLIQRNGP